MIVIICSFVAIIFSLSVIIYFEINEKNFWKGEAGKETEAGKKLINDLIKEINELLYSNNRLWWAFQTTKKKYLNLNHSYHNLKREYDKQYSLNAKVIKYDKLCAVITSKKRKKIQIMKRIIGV